MNMAQLWAFAESVKRFVAQQLLDMRWLDDCVAAVLRRGGLDPGSPLGSTAQLIACNVIRLTMLLIVLSVIRNLLNQLFSPERHRDRHFGGGAAALAGAAAGASSLKSAEATLPSRLATLVGHGMAPEAAAAFIFTAPFADPLTFSIVLTMAFGVRTALFCTISGAAFALLTGLAVGRIWRHIAETHREDAPGSARAPEPPRLREVPGRILAEIQYIFPYIVLGAGAGAFIRNWLPESWVQTFLGSTDPWAVCLAVVAGIPFGADLFGMLPIVVELQAKGAHPGVLTAFILSATAFTPAALFSFRRAVKPKLLLVIYALCLIWATGVGCLIDALPGAFK